MNIEKPTFKHICYMHLQQLTNFPYIEKDFDAITDYELLCKVVDYLNEVIKNNNEQNTVVTELYNAFVELKNYVDNFFDNLDVQDEVNNKLDEMAENGQLTDIIAQYLGLAGMITFNNVAEMKNAENLVNGSKCATLGFYSVNDGGNAFYKIRTITNDDVVDEMTIIALYDNTLIAELIQSDDIIASQYGLIPDSTETYVTDHWEFTTGTDYSDLLNHLLTLNKPIILPRGVIYITKPLKLYSRSILKGLDDMYSTRILFNGNNGEHAIETYDSEREVSFIELSNIRLTDIRENPTSGYGIYVNFVDNHVLLHHLFMDNFASGCIYVGYNGTTKAGDNIIIDDIWGVIPNTTNSLITIGNFNNVCTISNIFCDGGKVLSRTNHGYNIGIINITNVKHEVHNDQTGSASINIGDTDYIICNTIMRRNTPATSMEEAGTILNQISTRGIYLNCHVAYNSAPLNAEPFPDLPYNNSEGLYFQQLSPVINITKYLNYNGQYFYGKVNTFPIGRIGDLAFNGEKLYQKATTAGTNTGWLPIDVRRVYQSQSDIPHWHIEVGECVYILEDHKPYWLNDITSTVMHFYDATGTLAFSINQ